MRYLVISSCQDVRTGKEFEKGDEFLPEPDVAQAVRLKNAGCLEEIPDNAPALPGSDDSARVIADLRTTIGENAKKAEGEFNALNARLTDLTGKNDALVDENKTMRGLLDGASAEADKLRETIKGHEEAYENGRKELDRRAERIDELSRLLEAVTKPADAASDQTAPETAPAKKKA
jgi:chromosome segregation ATPase